MITVLPQPMQGDIHILAACEGGQTLGTVQYRTVQQTVHVTALDCPIDALADGLLRACLNAARAAGCVQAVCALDERLDWLQRKGFAVQNGAASVAIEPFFARGCRH